MRLLLVTPKFPPQFGGAATVFYLLAKGLSKKMHVTVITSSEKGFVKIESSGNFRVYRLFPYFRPIKRIFFMPLSFLLSFTFFLFNHRKFDVVETHTAGELCLFFQIFAIIFRKKLVKHVLDAQNPEFLLRHPMPDAFVCCGESLKKKIAGSGIAKSVIHDINLPIEHHKFAKNKASKKRIFLFIGEISKHKGVLDILAILPKVKEKNFEIWFVGNGNLAKTVEKVSETDKKIKYLGQMSHKELIEMYKKTDVLLHPTYRDVMPLAILDAMMMKNAIISTDIGEIKKVVGNGGIILNTGDKAQLERIINKMTTADLTKMKNRAYKNFEKYAQKDVIEENLNVLLH